MLEIVQQNWWLLLLRGLLALAFGIIALMSPDVILVTLLFYFGLVALFSGLFLITEGYSHKDSSRGVRIFEGVISLIFGLLFIFMPSFVLSFIMYFIAFWAIIAGIMQIVYAVKLRKTISNEWFGILNGIVTLIFGVLVLLNVLEGAQALVMVFGAFAVLSGVLMIALAFNIRGHKSEAVE